LALPGAVALQGGVPIIIDGKVVGAVGVSGNSPQEDEDIAKVGADYAAAAIKGEKQ
jgi:glc operon protein GlcG